MRAKRPPLSKEQQTLVEENIRFASILAHKTWRRFSLPAYYLDELKADAFIILCECAQRYIESDKCTFQTFAWGTLSKCLMKQAMIYQKWLPMGDWDKVVPSPVEDREPLPMEKELLAEISRLPEKQRVVIEYRFGLSGEPPLFFHEIAKRTGIPKSTVADTEQDGLAELRRVLGGCHVEGGNR